MTPLTRDDLDAVVDHVQFKDQVARLPQSPKSTVDPNSFFGQLGTAQEAARQERRRAMDEANARARAEAQAAAEKAQADADDARRQLAQLASKIQRRAAERREVDAKATALYRRDRDKHREFDARVKNLQARAAAVPPRRKETP